MTEATMPDSADQIKRLSEQIAEQRELIELMERRYNQEHQRGLQLELAGQKAEKLAVRLQAEINELIKPKENDNG